MLTYIDLASRWPEDIPLRSITTTSVLNALTSNFTRNGFPCVLVSDNETQFVSRKFKSFCARHGIQHNHSSPYGAFA